MNVVSRVLFAVLLVSLMPLPALAEVHRQTEATVDDVFGQARLTAFAIRTTLREVDHDIDLADTDQAGMFTDVLIHTEPALRDWQARYPDDKRLPQLSYLLLDDYRKLHLVFPDNTDVANEHARELLSWLEDIYPTI
jgi:hypothetical protein